MECELQDADTKFNSAEARTVGLVVVGDEILKGRTSDTNTGYAMAKFKESGLKVKRVAVVADQEDDIVEELRRQVSMCDVVVTSGGLGPTHDDVTLYAVARALGQAMTQNAQMMKLIRTQKAKRSPDPDAEKRKWPRCPWALSSVHLPDAQEGGLCYNVVGFLFCQECRNSLRKNWIQSARLSSRVGGQQLLEGYHWG
uniref:MoaB/Mog domain-containing protein n=1 Tax=Amorphochlora amoebiformis TaxID=1561963 RepID=A0A6T6V2U5_9EUKA|mmetsp:Transcript_23993/g.37725  ORF Transcript_23993/g.37725 Transcript_23993/m.37725 type:complete len:198 (-) Transcript_23993:307-900(-)